MIVDIVFDGPPGCESGRFVEVENEHGASVKVGTWIHREDGYWALRLDLASGRVPSADEIFELADQAARGYDIGQESQPPRTASGRVVSDDEFYELADEAERGYDVDHLR